MLGTARDLEADNDGGDGWQVVHYIEGKAIPEWKTDFNDLEADGVWEKSAVRLFLKAAREDDISVFRQLVKESSVNPNLRDKKGWTALLRAAKCNSLTVADWLCRAKADTNTMNLEKSTPLMKAAKFLHLRMVQLLLHHHANVNMESKGGGNALMFACQQNRSPSLQVVTAIVDGKAEVNHKKSDVNYTALMLAARHGNADALTILVNHHAGLDHADVQGETALAKALKYGNVECAGILTRAGAKPVNVTLPKKKLNPDGDSGRDSARMKRERSSDRRRSSSTGRSGTPKSRGSSTERTPKTS